MEVQRDALAGHCEKRDHKINFDGASVIEIEGSPGRRLLLESCHIQNTPANMSRSLGTMPLVHVHGLRDKWKGKAGVVVREQDTGTLL